jgi:hypothetical protein
MPDVSGVTVVTNACAYLTAHAAADAPSVRHSLRPLFFEGTSTQQLGRIAPRECGGVWLKLGRRHCEERSDEAIQSFLRLHGLLRFARNDGAGLFDN